MPPGKYLYFASSSTLQQQTAVLISAPLNHTSPRCISFWYYLSSSLGAARMLVSYTSTDAHQPVHIWNSSGHSGRSRQWRQGHAAIGTAGVYQVGHCLSPHTPPGFLCVRWCNVSDFSKKMALTCQPDIRGHEAPHLSLIHI